MIQQYPNGQSGIQKHRDKEMSNMICGISVGIEDPPSAGQRRTLSMYQYNKLLLNQPLNNGSLYILLEPTNNFYSHAINKDDSIGVRFSLTFRFL